jgi:hypothetical protein
MNLIVLGAMLSAFFLFWPPLSFGRTHRRKMPAARPGFPAENNFLNEELRQPFLQRFLKPVLKKVIKPLVAADRSHGKMSKAESKLARRLKLAGIDLSPASSPP